MHRIHPIDVGPFEGVEPMTEGCHAAWGTSFVLGSRFYTLTFEASKADSDEYASFCEEQDFNCSELVVVKFDHAYNVDSQDMFKRIPLEHRLDAGEMIQLSKMLAGGLLRFVKEFQPTVVVGVPNDGKLARWYTRLSERFSLQGHLISMRETSYSLHRVLVIHRV